MEDLWKGLAIGFGCLFAIHANLQPRIRDGAANQVRETFKGGRVFAKVEPRGALGLLANDIWAVDIYADGVKSAGLPFRIIPRGGWKGSIRHLRVHLTNFELNGLPIARMETDIPFAKYDLGRALYKHRLKLRSAEAGPASVWISPNNLRAFLRKKFETLLSNVEIDLMPDRVRISGRLNLLGSPTPFQTTGGLKTRDGRYLDLVDVEIRLNNAPLSPQGVAALLQRINPVLDVERDLNLKNFFRLSSVSISPEFVKISGEITVPTAEPQTTPPPTTKE